MCLDIAGGLPIAEIGSVRPLGATPLQFLNHGSCALSGHRVSQSLLPEVLLGSRGERLLTQQLVGHVDHVVASTLCTQQNEHSFHHLLHRNPVDRVVLIEIDDIGLIAFIILQKD